MVANMFTIEFQAYHFYCVISTLQNSIWIWKQGLETEQAQMKQIMPMYSDYGPLLCKVKTFRK